MSTIEGLLCIQDTSPGPQGVHTEGFHSKVLGWANGDSLTVLFVGAVRAMADVVTDVVAADAFAEPVSTGDEQVSAVDVWGRQGPSQQIIRTSLHLLTSYVFFSNNIVQCKLFLH